MVKSSIHIQGSGSLESTIFHNSRENASFSVVFFNEKNEIENNAKEAYETYKKELMQRQQTYIFRTKQSPQKNTLNQLSAIMNLHQHHTLTDIKIIVNYLEEKLDTKVFQVAIHRDEGKLVHYWTRKELFSGKTFFYNPKSQTYYYDKDYFNKIDLNMYSIVKNYHAHLEMLGIDSEGKSIKRNRLNKYFLQNLQTFVADALEMERGVNTISYTKEEIKKIISVIGPKDQSNSTSAWLKSFNNLAKKLGIFKVKKKRKDTKIFKEYGAIVQDLEEQIFNLKSDKDNLDYELELEQEQNEELKRINNNFENDNFNLRDDVFILQQALQAIRRDLDIFYGIEFEEADLAFEKFHMEEVNEIIERVSYLIDSTVSPLLLKDKNNLTKKRERHSNNSVHKDDSSSNIDYDEQECFYQNTKF